MPLIDGVDVAGRVVVGIGVPLAGTRRDDKRARRDQVGFEPAGVAFDADADRAAAGEAGDLVAGIGHGQPRLVGGARLLVSADGRAFPHLVGDVAELLDGAHGDDVLGGARATGWCPGCRLPSRVAAAGIAGGKHIQQRL